MRAIPEATTTAAAKKSSEDSVVAVCPQGAPIRLVSVAVKRGRLVCELVIPDERRRFSTPRLASYVETNYPDIARHACVNESGRQFGAVMQSTSIAHLLEHIAIDEQVHDSENDDALFVGTTEWLDEQAGRARIQLSFRDDLSALEAFNKALQFLNIAVITYLP